MAPNTTVEIPCETLAAGTAEEDEGDAMGDSDDKLDSELDDALDCVREVVEEGGAVSVGVRVGVAGDVGNGEIVAGGVNPPYVQMPSVPRGICYDAVISNAILGRISRQ